MSLAGRNEQSIRDLVNELVLKELRPGESLPADDVDLVKAGFLDSMGWVGVLSAIEEATGIRDFGTAWPEGSPQSVRALVEAIRAGVRTHTALAADRRLADSKAGASVAALGWGSALGSLLIDAETVECEVELAPGTIRDRAGIRTIVRAAEAENEMSLGAKAAQAALQAASVEPEAIDILVVTSATALALPSLAAGLHSRLLLRETSGALDVGGACVGFIHALATAKALLSTEGRRVALVVASEVNSRRLKNAQAPGEFRGLFGDGACALVLARTQGSDSAPSATLGEFTWGCSGAFSSSLRIALREAGNLEVQFKGEQLASAAVTTLERVVEHLENLSGVPRSEVTAFALHEPNPRIIEIFAQRAKIPMERITQSAAHTGNLGSVTCGVNLCHALSHLRIECEPSGRAVVFVAAVGPGLLWGGTYLSSGGEAPKHP